MTYVGIDVAKAKLDVAVKTTKKPRHLTVENTEKGFAKLVGWLAKYPKNELHVCLEATSTYGVDCALALSNQGIQVSVVNPFLVKAYAESELRRNKTDKLDAALIADFCAEKSPRSWTPPSETEQRFTSLYRRWETLKVIKAQELNRFESERCEDTLVSITSHLSYLDEQLSAVEAALDCLVEQTPQLQQQLRLLSSIPGVGKVTAYLLMAEVDFQVFTAANQLVAFAGLNPKHNQSGNIIPSFVLYGCASNTRANVPCLSSLLPCGNSCTLPSVLSKRTHLSTLTISIIIKPKPFKILDF